jgi:hypothetical protein
MTSSLIKELRSPAGKADVVVVTLCGCMNVLVRSGLSKTFIFYRRE